jgi:hypothetical protein
VDNVPLTARVTQQLRAVPGTLTYDPVWSLGCRAHSLTLMNYLVNVPIRQQLGKFITICPELQCTVVGSECPPLVGWLLDHMSRLGIDREKYCTV